jgi:hypothetical protein
LARSSVINLFLIRRRRAPSLGSTPFVEVAKDAPRFRRGARNRRLNSTLRSVRPPLQSASARNAVDAQTRRRPNAVQTSTKILRFAEKESFITNYNAVVRIRNKHFWKITIICIKTARTKRQNRKKK